MSTRDREGVDTRSNKKETMSEEARKLQARATEIQNYESQILDKDARLKSQEAKIRQQIEELEINRSKFERERDNYSREMETRESEVLLREKEVEKRWVDATDVTPLGSMHQAMPQETLISQTYGVPQSNEYGNALNMSTQMPKVSFREATEYVPSFDGYNIPLTQFTRACRRARELIPPHSEHNLTKLLINKLRGRAYYAVEDEPCDTVAQLVDLLNGAFGSPQTIDQYRGELSAIYLKPHEHVLDYISRVKDLRTTILDTERRLQGQLNLHFLAEIDQLTSRSFCDGLPLEFRLQMRTDKYMPHTEAFAIAKTIAKRQELDKLRYETRGQAGREYREMKPIGRPLAHSTPQRDNNYYSRQEPVTRSPVSPYRNQPSRDYGTRNQRPASAGMNRDREDVARRENTRHANDNEISCRYCKNVGHTIDECRKRQYYNSRKNESGNAHSSSGRPDATRANDLKNTRPVNPISIENNAEQESPC